jgi:hypothetical protein
MRSACVRVEQQSAHPLAEGAEIGLSLPLDEADPAVEALKDRAMRLVVVGGEAGPRVEFMDRSEKEET